MDTGTADPKQNNLPRISTVSEAIHLLQSHPLSVATDAVSLRTTHQLISHTLELINTADITSLQHIRSQLHPLHDFLPYIATLHSSLARLNNDSPLVPQLLAEFVKLVHSTPAPHALHASLRWIGACRHAARIVIETRSTQRAIALLRPLRLAADKLAPAPDYLVAVHADFLAVCLQAKCYHLATTWLRKHKRLQLDPTTGVQASDVHLIYHYAAIAYIGVKDFKAALQCCRLAFAVPAPTPGPFLSVATLTFKYFVLLHLLVTGSAPQQFKFSSYQFSRLRKITSEYSELASAYERMDRTQTQHVFESNCEAFAKHGNLGLVKQVMRSLTDELIGRLTNSFVTMKIENVATRVGLANEEEAHKVIARMIEEGKINARIDDRKRVARLVDGETRIDETLCREVCGVLMQQSLDVLQRVDEFRENMENDPEYVRKAMNSRRSRRSATTHGLDSSAAGPSGSHKGVDTAFMR